MVVLVKNKVIVALAILLAGFLAAAGFLWGAGFLVPPVRKPAAVARSEMFNHRVTEDTIIFKDIEYLCGDIEKISEEKAPGELWGLDKNALYEKFPALDGWSVNFTDPKFLTLTVKPDEFCPVHRSYRHFGLYQEMLAVFEGPLGFDGRLLRVESIPLDALDPGFRLKLEQAGDINRLDYQTAEKLREDLEFATEEALNAALDNLDEHSQGENMPI